MAALGFRLYLPSAAWGQTPPAAGSEATTPAASTAPATPKPVDVEPLALDSDISARLTRILESTEWFNTPRVEVENGVVFLTGTTTKEEYKQWATSLAERTQDVVAVVNRIKIPNQPIWDFSPAFAQLQDLARRTVRSIPTWIVALISLVVVWYAMRLASWGARRIWRRRLGNSLLLDIVGVSAATPVLLIGIYVMLRVSGLTQLALTVLGGTGLAGLVIGIAFRDIAENFLASVLLSVQQPFHAGDMIQVDVHQGIVQKVTARGTLLMAQNGAYIQIPNATVYKSVIRNITANPQQRCDFVVTIGSANSVDEAQDIAMDVLHKHSAVLPDPEPMVLVEQLAGASVRLRVYFWIDLREYSNLRVQSALQRQLRAAFRAEGIAPFGTTSEAKSTRAPRRAGEKQRSSDATAAEGKLRSEKSEIDAQAAKSPAPEMGEDLLATPVASASRNETNGHSEAAGAELSERRDER
ncbi:MAG: mechanosensitive ion channel domain-containing protein [Pirellulales bacterium]